MCNQKALCFPFRLFIHNHTKPCAESKGKCTPKCCIGSACGVCCLPCYLTCWIPFCVAYYGCGCCICHNEEFEHKVGMTED